MTALRAARPDVTIDVMSSGSGVEYYRARSVDCADLGIPDDNDISNAANWAVWRHLARSPNRWDLVITDEVVSAVPFAHHVLDAPAVVLTDWFFADFGNPRHDRVFDTAAEVIVLDFEQSHPDRPGTTAPVHHAGPVVEDFGVDRTAARTAVGITGPEPVVVLTLGGMPKRPEAARMIDSVLKAWDGLAGDRGRLFVLADPVVAGDAGTAERDGVTWAGVTATPDLYYAAADLVLVDAMGFTGCELAFNRRRVLALTDARALGTFPASFRHRLAHMASQGWVDTVDAACGAERLRSLITDARADRTPTVPMPTANLGALAARILGHG